MEQSSVEPTEETSDQPTKMMSTTTTPTVSFKLYRDLQTGQSSKVVSVRWSRSGSLTPTSPSDSKSKQLTTSQLEAGRRIVRKYRRFARNLEYRRLHCLIPSINKRRRASKMTILREAIKYIDSLHKQLVHSLRARGLDRTEENDDDDDGSRGANKLSSTSAISLIQSALQPEIEKKLVTKRMLDRVNEKVLWQEATTSLAATTAADESRRAEEEDASGRGKGKVEPRLDE